MCEVRYHYTQFAFAPSHTFGLCEQGFSHFLSLLPQCLRAAPTGDMSLNYNARVYLLEHKIRQDQRIRITKHEEIVFINEVYVETNSSPLTSLSV